MDQDWADMGSSDDETPSPDSPDVDEPEPVKKIVEKPIQSIDTVPKKINNDPISLILKGVPYAIHDNDLKAALHDWNFRIEHWLNGDNGLKNVIINVNPINGKPSLDDIWKRELILFKEKISIDIYEQRRKNYNNNNRNGNRGGRGGDRGGDRNNRNNGRNDRNNNNNSYYKKDNNNNNNNYNSNYNNNNNNNSYYNNNKDRKLNSSLFSSSNSSYKKTPKVEEEFKISERPPEKKLNILPPSKITPEEEGEGGGIENILTKTESTHSIFGGAKPRELNLQSKSSQSSSATTSPDVKVQQPVEPPILELNKSIENSELVSPISTSNNNYNSDNRKYNNNNINKRYKNFNRIAKNPKNNGLHTPQPEKTQIPPNLHPKTPQPSMSPPLSSPSESSDISSPIIIQPQPQDIIHNKYNNNGRRNDYGTYQINNRNNRKDYNNNNYYYSGKSNNRSNYYPPAVSLGNEYNNNEVEQQPPPLPPSSTSIPTDTTTTTTTRNKDYSKPAYERTINGMSTKMRGGGGGKNRGSYSSRGGGRQQQQQQRFSDSDRIVEIHRKGYSDSYGNNNKY